MIEAIPSAIPLVFFSTILDCQRISPRIPSTISTCWLAGSSSHPSGHEPGSAPQRARREMDALAAALRRVLALAQRPRAVLALARQFR